MRGEELIAALKEAPHDALRQRVSLDLGPGIWADVLGVRYSSGHAEGWRLELELGPWHIPPIAERE